MLDNAAPVELLRTFRERLLSGFSWNVVSAVALQGSVLLSSILVARLVGVSSFGAYAILVSTVMTIAGVAQGGSGAVATKYVGERLAADRAGVARALLMCRTFTFATGAAAAAIVFVGAHALSAQVLGKPELASLVRISALAVLFQVPVSYQLGGLQGFGAFKHISRASVLAGIAHVGFTTLGAWLGQLEGAVIGFVMASALRATVFGRLLVVVARAHDVPQEVSFNRGEFKEILRFALPAGLAGFVTMPCLWLVTVLVARLPDGLALAAIFSVAHQVRLAVLQLPLLLNAVSFSTLSRLKGLNEVAGFRSVFWAGIWLNLAFAMLVVALLFVAADPVLRLYGRDFTPGRLALSLLLVSVLPELFATSMYQLVQSAGRMWHSLFLIAIPRDLLYVGLAFLFVPTHGVNAAAAAYVAAHAVGLVMTLFTAWQYSMQSLPTVVGR